jgi:hypothetical protein
MPGLNFVAYVTQTMGEVKTGRKALAPALSQFDQTLIMQGVSVVKRKSAPISEEKPPVLQRDPHAPILSPQTPLPPRPRLEPSIAQPKARPVFETGGPRVLGSAVSPLRAEVQEFRMGDLGPDSEETPETAPVVANEPPDAPDIQEPEKQPVRIEAVQTDLSVHTGTETEIAEEASGEVLAEADPGAQVSHSFDRSDVETEDDASPEQEASPIKLDEKGIEQQILAFEEELSLWCPLCNKDRVEASTTPTGRTYYKCVSRDCHFVSWGRPLHHPCPRCKNPFLIQISDKSGRMAYKCPRATCHFYRLVGESDAAPDVTRTPVRRVVRRRVVRRKN